jgi:hypothetical protein
MDYTKNPKSSMHPDVTNFEFLAAIYGSIDGTIRAGASSNSTGISRSNGTEVNSSNGGVSRQLRPQRTTDSMHKAVKQDYDSKEIAGWISKRIQSFHQKLTGQRRFVLRQKQEEQFLESSSTLTSRNIVLYGGEMQQIELGQGYSMVVHMLHGDSS